MTPHAETRLRAALRDRFYYIYTSYPDRVPADFWRDGNGELHLLEDMGMDHLKASIKRIEKDREAYCRDEAFEDAFPEVSAVLLPLIDEKLAELKRVFRQKATL